MRRRGGRCVGQHGTNLVRSGPRHGALCTSARSQGLQRHEVGYGGPKWIMHCLQNTDALTHDAQRSTAKKYLSRNGWIRPVAESGCPPSHLKQQFFKEEMTFLVRYEETNEKTRPYHDPIGLRRSNLLPTFRSFYLPSKLPSQILQGVFEALESSGGFRMEFGRYFGF